MLIGTGVVINVAVGKTATDVAGDIAVGIMGLLVDTGCKVTGLDVGIESVGIGVRVGITALVGTSVTSICSSGALVKLQDARRIDKSTA